MNSPIKSTQSQSKSIVIEITCIPCIPGDLWETMRRCRILMNWSAVSAIGESEFFIFRHAVTTELIDLVIYCKCARGFLRECHRLPYIFSARRLVEIKVGSPNYSIIEYSTRTFLNVLSINQTARSPPFAFTLFYRSTGGRDRKIQTLDEKLPHATLFS